MLLKNKEAFKRKVQEYIDSGYVRRKKHPTHDLWIYNYTPKCQYAEFWDEITLNCRGLILDSDYEIVAKPFEKFFNLEQVKAEDIPSSDYKIYEKMDGSLGILYWLDDEPHIATRGSFDSVQALRATELLQTKYREYIKYLKRGWTYLFEIIVAESKVVIEYDKEYLVLIGVINNATFRDETLVDIGFPIAQSYAGTKDFRELKQLNTKGKEGFVVHFEDGFRVKIKFEEYVRVHKLRTSISNLAVWENLKCGFDFNELLEDIPDEMFDWIKKVKEKLERQYAEIEAVAKFEFKVFETRKEAAEYFKKCSYPRILFLMLDARDYSELIWNRVRPKEFLKPRNLMNN
ncbi:MAG: T4 RnlA family RNA ligase [Chitinophagales bacterium]